MNIYAKCSNYASETCPCVLAESGHCIMCSMCRGEEYCDCNDTVSYCIMQELKNNGGKAKDQHHIVKCTVQSETMYEDNVKFIRLNVPNGQAEDFKRIGSFVFVRAKENTFYDVPISVMYEGVDVDSIGLIIQLQGVKTKDFSDLKVGDRVFLRGPYLNGIQGLRPLVSLKNKNAVIICKGIGLFPSIHAIDELKKNNNNVKIYLDSGDINRSIINAARDLFEMEINEMSLFDANKNISEEVYSIVDEAIRGNVAHIHLGLSNYAIKKIVEYIENRAGSDISLSCINNSHMCCGEGICGACTVNVDSKRIVHLCKEQLDVYDYGRLLR